MRGKRVRARRGFTLMEMLLVLAIIVLVGSTVTYYFVGMQRSANERAAQGQIAALEQMLNTYRITVGTYPTTSDGLQALYQQPSGGDATKWRQVADRPIPLDPWGNPYQYELVTPDQFRVWSWGADGIDGTDDDISNR